MSSESDYEEFFDAEDNTPVKNARAKAKCSLSWQSLSAQPIEESTSKEAIAQEPLPDLDSWESEDVLKISVSSEADQKELERKAHENEMRRRKLADMRRKVQNDDDDSFYIGSQTCSQASSIDSLYVQHQHLKPGGEDAQSIVSLGKVGRILSGSETISLQDHNLNSCIISESGLHSGSSSRTKVEEGHKGLHEPDVVASTKSDRLAENSPPKPPPRRKDRRKRKPPVEPLNPPVTVDTPSIPSPASTVESIAKEFEHSLDLKSAIKGNKVVKPQDEEKDKAEGPPPLEHFIITGPLEVTDEEGLIQQLNMMVRTRTDSGKQLTDLEILEQVTVLNLDTGERIPLSLAEERLPRGINPLSLHIMRLTSEYVSNSSLDKHKESDEEADENKKPVHSVEHTDGTGTKSRKRHIKKLINRTVNKIKSVADVRRGDDQVESSEDEPVTDPKHNIKFKAASSHKGPYEFDNFKLIQDLSGEHSGAVWTMKFSYCGRLLATAGQDHILRVWVLRDAFDYFSDMRHRYNAETKVSPTPSQESLTSHQSAEDCDRMGNAGDSEASDDSKSVFMPKAFCTYPGHTAEILDVSWSKNYFILSSSMDKTVRLWHISRRECLCCFQHIDFVTAIAFHPRDDRYFISGSLDGKLRLWNIPDKKVALWNELDGQTKLITAANFCQNGKFAVVGTYDGRCVFYNTEQLKYYTQIDVRSTRGKNAKGRKISGIEPMPGEDKILITSNDSRIRLYDLRDLSLSCKYKGYVNLSSQIRAGFSHDGKFIVSGSENQCIYIWKTHHDYSKFSSARRDRNEFWEGIKGHNAVVTAAVFAPNPTIIFKQMEKFKTEEPGSSATSDNPSGYILVTADFNGAIKVFGNQGKIKTT